MMYVLESDNVYAVPFSLVAGFAIGVICLGVSLLVASFLSGYISVLGQAYGIVLSVAMDLVLLWASARAIVRTKTGALIRVVPYSIAFIVPLALVFFFSFSIK